MPLSAVHLNSAAELLRLTNHGPSLEALSEDLTRSIAAWPGLQLGAFLPGDYQLVGLIAGRIAKEDPTLGWSDDLVILERFRGTGLGKTLLTRQLDEFRALGCDRVRGLSPRRLFGAIPFFERHGFRVVEREVSNGLFGIPDGDELCVTELRLDQPVDLREKLRAV